MLGVNLMLGGVCTSGGVPMIDLSGTVMTATAVDALLSTHVASGKANGWLRIPTLPSAAGITHLEQLYDRGWIIIGPTAADLYSQAYVTDYNSWTKDGDLAPTVTNNFEPIFGGYAARCQFDRAPSALSRIYATYVKYIGSKLTFALPIKSRSGPAHVGMRLYDQAQLLTIDTQWSTKRGDVTLTAANLQPQILLWSSIDGCDVTADVLLAESVIYPKNTIQIVCDGNSLTSGQGSTGGNTYPAQLAALIPGSAIGRTLEMLNLGVGGATTAQRAAADATHAYANPYACAVLWEATNDLYVNDDLTGAISRYVAWCNQVRADGYAVVACTVLPRSNVGTPAGFEANRISFNTYVRNNYSAFAEALADIAANTDIGEAGDETNATYYSGDNVHLSNAGYAIVAQIVLDALTPLVTN